MNKLERESYAVEWNKAVQPYEHFAVLHFRKSKIELFSYGNNKLFFNF